MAATNGMIVIKILKRTRMKETARKAVITNDGMKIMANLMKNNDVPKEMNGNHPEIGTVTKATVDLGNL